MPSELKKSVMKTMPVCANYSFDGNHYDGDNTDSIKHVSKEETNNIFVV